MEDIQLQIRSEEIRINDNYKSCVKRVERQQYIPCSNYVEELEKMKELDWLFEFPADVARGRKLELPKNDSKFLKVLENVFKSLDSSIQQVEESKEVKDTYIVRLSSGKTVIIQDGVLFTSDILSSGTRAGVGIACVISSLMQKRNTFYYCDEQFPFVHTDVEKAMLSLMVELIPDNAQIFITTHNSDVLDLKFPKHSFLFMRKDVNNTDSPITCIEASALLKRSTDSLRNAVENDLFCTSPSVELLYEISEI